MNFKRTLTLVGAAALSIALTTSCGVLKGGSGGKTKADAANAIAAAEAANKKSKALKWIWRDVGKFIKKAKEAEKKGHYANAVKLANKARAQANLAVQQYHYENTRDRSVKRKKRKRRSRKRRK